MCVPLAHLRRALLCSWVSVCGCTAEPPARPTEPATTPAPRPDEPNGSKAALASPTPTTAATPIAATGPAPKIETRFADAPRVVAIGDVHGDIDATRRALELSGLLSEDDHWAGGPTVLVQTGDQLDRGDDEQEILDLLERLVVEADKAGGAVHLLNGNHELMNAAGDFRYVTPGGMADFADAPGVDVSAPALADVPEVAKSRAAAFLPGGAYAKRLARRNTAVIVGPTVFVHGGVLPKYARKLDALNQTVRAWLWGEEVSPAEALAPDGLVWTRMFSEPAPSEDACATLAESLKLLGVERMVVGHTVQKQGITSACDETVWRIDVGMAAHYGGKPAALEIRGDAVTVLTEN